MFGHLVAIFGASLGLILLISGNKEGAGFLLLFLGMAQLWLKEACDKIIFRLDKLVMYAEELSAAKKKG